MTWIRSPATAPAALALAMLPAQPLTVSWASIHPTKFCVLLYAEVAFIPTMLSAKSFSSARAVVGSASPSTAANTQ